MALDQEVAAGITNAGNIQLVGNGFKEADPKEPPPPHIPTTEDRERGLLGRVAEGAAIGGLLGIPEGGIGVVPGMISGGAIGGIEWFIEETQK